MINNYSYPTKRMRRMRYDDFSRRLCQENTLNVSDLIYPVFVIDHPSIIQPIKAMPGQNRLGTYPLLKICEKCCELKIPAIALFPVIDSALKSEDAKEAYNPMGLIPKMVKEIKSNFPSLGVITDIALDPYTSHGQDGLIDNKGYVLNDETISVLKRQAVCHAQAGADIVAPSDMMDGRIGAIRASLDQHAFVNARILAYSAKYASAFYGPFRDAVGSMGALGNADKKTYQMDPRNSNEALHEVSLDLSEGADIVMVKPGGLYLDIIWRIKSTYSVPTFAYQVSGEYSMIKAAAEQKWLDEQSCMIESLLGFKRAGCDAILTYFALEAASWLQKN